MLVFSVLLSACSSTVKMDAPTATAAPPVHLPAPAPKEVAAMSKEVSVFFVTDRAPSKSGQGFGSNRADGQLTRGTVLVSIPMDRARGDVPRPGWFAQKLGMQPNPRKHMFIMGMTTLSAQDFFAKIKAESGEERSVLVFVHGYNNSFEEATLRTAQISYDMGMPFLPALFSWSSSGRTAAYFKDSDSAAIAKPAFVDFLQDLIMKSDAQRLYVLGHSMGTRIVSEGIAEFVEKKPEWKDRIKEVLLAAADINAVMFEEQIAPRLEALQLNVTMYASASDNALNMSKAFQGYSRAGDIDKGLPVRVKTIEIIDATGVQTDWLAHSYVASSITLLTDMEKLFRTGTRAGGRSPLKLSPLSSEERKFWVFP